MVCRLKKRDFALLIYIGIITFLMAAFSVSCSMLDRHGNIVWTESLFKRTMVFSLVAGLVGAVICGFVMVWMKKKEVKMQFLQRNVTGKLPKWTWISVGAIFAAWFPAFLAFYPSLCSYDAEGYFFQLVYDAYNNHHPIAYTLLVEGFYYLGENLFGSYTMGIGLFTLVQMLFLAFSFGVFIRIVYRIYSQRWLFITLTALFALHPMNACMSVTMTKDIYFAAGMLLAFSALMAKFFLEETGKEKWKSDLCFVAGLVLVVMFRSNGRYCILAALCIEVLCLWIYKKKRKDVFRIFLGSLLAFVVGMLLVSAIDKATNAQEVDKREMFSLPAQQIARVVHFHEEELSEETMQQIETVIWPSSLYMYNRRTARFVKQDVISYEILHYPKKYLTLYLNLLEEYPGDYVNAFLGLYSGFLNPWDKSHIRINEDFNGVLEDGMHYIQTAFVVTDRFMVDNNPISDTLHKLYCWYSDNDIYMKIPVLSFLFVPGVYLWVMLYCFGILVYQKKGILSIPCALVFSYFLTFLLGPTVQLRYIFPIMICTPGIILFTLIKMRRDENEIDNTDPLL